MTVLSKIFDQLKAISSNKMNIDIKLLQYEWNTFNQ